MDTPVPSKKRKSPVTQQPGERSKAKKNRTRTSVSVGKDVSEALKKNFARSMAAAFADYIIVLTNKKYKEESETSYNKDFDSTDTFVGVEPPKKCCPTEIKQWLSSAEEAFKSFANFIISLETSSDGKHTLLSLYQEDVRKAVEAVMYRQELFDTESSVARGLARFDTHINLIPSDKISVLDSSIEVETQKGNSLNTLNAFKDETKELLCPRVTDLLKHLPPDSATSTFNDVVNYVKKSFSFYESWGDLPGGEFRVLLADINIKIMQRALKSEVFGSSSNLSEEDSRIMINALQQIRAWKPISKDYPSRIDKARDVTLMPETGNISRVPITPTNLLQLVSYVNALLSLEQRKVFTNGFFNAACVLISQCLSTTQNLSNSSIRPSKAAAKIARDNLLRLHIVQNSPKISEAKNKIAEEEEEEQMSVVDESLSENEDNSEKDTTLRDLIYKTGGFFYDTSEFGKKIKNLLSLRDHIGLVNYASSLLDSRSEIAVQRLVASLIDALILKTEQCEELKTRGKTTAITITNTVQTRKEIAKMLLNQQADKYEMAKYFISEAEPSIVPKHEAYVLTQRLLPSDNNNDIGSITSSFFKKKKDMEVKQPACSELNNHPDLFNFLKELIGEITKIIVTVLNESTDQKMEVDTFLKNFSPLGLKLNIPARIKSAIMIVTGDEQMTNILFSPVHDANTVGGLKLATLIKTVSESRHIENIRQNAAELNDKIALSIMLFPPSLDKNDDEISILSNLAEGLFSIAEGSIAVIRSKDFDDTASSFALLLDANTMDNAVKFAASTLERATAKALYADEDMRPSRVLEGASFVEGALSYIIDRKDIINSGECPEPTPLAKYTMTNITGRYLKRLKEQGKRASSSPERAADPALAREEALSDKALVEEVTNRATDIVISQIANAMGVAIIMSAAIKVLQEDVEETEARSTNNQTTSLEDYNGTKENVVKRVGVIRNLAHLCITTAVAAASDMTKLSNQHFLNLIKEANATMTKKKTPTKYDEKDMKKAMLLGYANKPEEFYHHKHGSGHREKGEVTSFGNVTRNWLYNAINSITNYKSSTKSTDAARDTQESLMDKLNKMVK